MHTKERQLFSAVITHKGRQIHELTGEEPKALEARAHRHASDLNFHRAVVQVRPIG